ncbi:MAG: deoxyribonuclease V [Dehalococcoidales bacterium]|nr:MAG: deoxyribonuclease V [Dehalococcoidales bacterium]
MRKRHTWQLSIAEAVEMQQRLSAQVLRSGEVVRPRFIAGVDVSVSRARGGATGAVVVLEYPGLRLVEVRLVHGEVDFPYVPGLLSFREAPLVLEACEALKITPDLVLVDGQGIAHPRRIGLASHLGLFLDVPTIGCAKSRLCGSHGTPENEPGSYAKLVDKGEIIGVALRTKVRTKPVYISVGHRVELPIAVHWVLECCQGYRLPEPIRLAHQAAGGNLKPKEPVSIPESAIKNGFSR